MPARVSLASVFAVMSAVAARFFAHHSAIAVAAGDVVADAAQAAA